MLNLLAYNFWYNLWNPMYEAMFGSIHDSSGWLNWGFWFSMVVIAVLAVIYIVVFWCIRPKKKDAPKDIRKGHKHKTDGTMPDAHDSGSASSK
ncbi:MAG: hypothetical protein LUD50_04465 [Clostridia bacterium]|nr:hypothetical protein [Clostridia bacterium]